MTKNQLIYLVKHNQFIKNTYVFLGSIFLKFLGIFIGTDSKLVLFVPNTGSTFSGSPRDIYEYMQSQNDLRDYDCLWAFNEPEFMSEKFGLNTVKLDSFKYFIATLRAKYWIADINVERGLKYKKKETIFLNTWHGVALKKIGNDDSKSAKYDYSDITHLCVSGDHDKKVFKSALKASDMSFLECGMPRNDRLFKVTEQERLELRKKLNIPTGKKVIAYIPTWRDSHDNGKTFSLKIKANFKMWEDVLNDEFVLLFRAHHRTTSLMNVEFTDFLRDYSNYPDLNDILIVSDVLITDYSSVVFDFSILGKPFICFAYDYEEYLQERGCYIDPKIVFPQGILTNEEEVLNQLRTMDVKRESEKTKEIYKQFMNYSEGNATQICVEKVFGSKKNGK
ncbi:CDP-glycerol--glycerophosphate glycerophosphotransferase [Streptococcus suis]|nr:CDP-glycerol--glycerophosphate glycerophosphotransferase [Streptococcus suis]